MFGINAVVAAFKRLAASLNRSADLVDAANERAEQFLSFDAPQQPAIEHRNGTTKPVKART